MARMFTEAGPKCRLLRGVEDGGRACRKDGMGWGGMGVHEWMMYKQHAQLEAKSI